MTRDGTQFIIINHCENREFGYSEEYGSLVKLSRQQIEQDGLAIVLHSLEEYPQRRKVGKSELESLPRSVQDTFDREHLHVSLSLQSRDELWLAPMHRGKNGGRISGDMLETQIVKLPTTSTFFFKALTAAFHNAD